MSKFPSAAPHDAIGYVFALFVRHTSRGIWSVTSWSAREKKKVKFEEMEVSCHFRICQVVTLWNSRFNLRSSLAIDIETINSISSSIVTLRNRCNKNTLRLSVRHHCQGLSADRLLSGVYLIEGHQASCVWYCIWLCKVTQGLLESLWIP